MEDKYECSKHPSNLRGLTPKKFAEEFVKTNYFYQKECFKEIAEEYKRELERDIKKGRTQLAKGLEDLTLTLENPINDAMQKICNACKKYLENPFSP